MSITQNRKQLSKNQIKKRKFNQLLIIISDPIISKSLWSSALWNLIAQNLDKLLGLE